MSVSERIDGLVNEIRYYREQIESVEKQIFALQQRRQALEISFHKADGGLAALTSLKDDLEHGVAPSEEILEG
jgi:hypothetical protein